MLRFRHNMALLLPLFLYLAIAYVLMGGASGWTSGYFGVGRDPISFVWFLHWWPFAIRHGLNPFVTDYVWSPQGFNLAWATAMPTAALAMAPVSHFFGPLLSFNLLTFAAPALAAWTAFLLCEYITKNWLASLFGSYFFGFSSYELGQLFGHLNLDFICLVPLVVLICIRRVRGDMPRFAFIAALAACMLAQLGLSTEILAALCLFGSGTWVIFFCCADKDGRQKMLQMAIDVAIAAPITLLLASPFLYYIIKGLSQVPPAINDPRDYVTDPRNLLIPTLTIWLNSPYFQNIAQQFSGNGSEQGGYLGLPLLLLVTIFFVSQIRRVYVWPLLLAILLAAMCSFGPSLQMGPHVSHLPLPWRLVMHVPVYNQLLPSRFSMFVALGIAIAAALALATARGWLRWLSYGLAIAACITLLPARNILPWTAWPSSSFLTPENIQAKLGKMPNVLILPFADAGPGMAWQLNAQMSFRQAGGHAGYVPNSEHNNPLFWNLYSGNADTLTIKLLDAFCVTHGVQYILLAPNTVPAQAAAILAQGWPAQAAEGGTIIKVPSADSIAYFSLTGDYWGSPAPNNWMGKQIKIVTHNFPLHLKLLGQWTRPSPSMRISVTVGENTMVYPVTQKTVIPVDVPANATATITANETWVPDLNADNRHLSVMLALDGP